MSKTTLDDVRLIPSVRVINAVGDWLDRHGIHLVSLSHEKLLADAMRRTRLSNWGEDAEAFKTDLERCFPTATMRN